MIELNQILKRGEEYVHSAIDGEMVMMNINTGMYTSLNETAVAIWEILENPMTVAEILVKLQESYDVSEEQCKIDVLPFFDQLVERKITIKEN